MYIKTIILILLSLFLSSNSWGQSVQDMLNKGVTSYDNKNKITVNDSEKFKELLISENYRDFFGAIADLKNKNKEEYEKVLLSQRDMGHVPVYWLLADLYAGGNEKEQELSKKFLYIALIMTQQDSSLCVDQTAKYATSNLLNYFKQTAEIAKKDNKNNAKIIQDAIFYIRSLKIRSHPRWACVYGNNVNSYSPQNMTISKESWNKNRDLVLDKYVKHMELNK